MNCHRRNQFLLAVKTADVILDIPNESRDLKYDMMFQGTPRGFGPYDVSNVNLILQHAWKNLFGAVPRTAGRGRHTHCSCHGKKYFFGCCRENHDHPCGLRTVVDCRYSAATSDCSDDHQVFSETHYGYHTDPPLFYGLHIVDCHWSAAMNDCYNGRQFSFSVLCVYHPVVLLVYDVLMFCRRDTRTADASRVCFDWSLRGRRNLVG